VSHARRLTKHQSIFANLGVTTRGAAALFAVENGLL
jgi:hypothetical protein